MVTIKPQEAMIRLGTLVANVANDELRGCCMHVLRDERFAECPGSARKHQPYKGGLAVHTFEVADGALAAARSSLLAGGVSQDVVIAGALWHDYGKIWDYRAMPSSFLPSPQPTCGYTRHRWTVRHLSRSYAEFLAAARQAKVSDDLAEEVSHVILAHHGRQEWGSPMAPMTVEAWLVFSADMVSAEYMTKAHPFRYERTEWAEQP